MELDKMRDIRESKPCRKCGHYTIRSSGLCGDCEEGLSE